MNRLTLLFAGTFAAFQCAAALGAPIVDAGIHSIGLGQTATIAITVTSTPLEPIRDLQLYLVIGDPATPTVATTTPRHH